MNLFYYYITIIKEYFSSKYFFLITFFTIFFIYFLFIILNFLINIENFYLVYWHFIAPFITYISMVFFISFYYYKKTKQQNNLLNCFSQLLLKALIIIVIKLIWNFCKIILIESNIIIIKEDSHLYPLFLLGFSWILIYFLSGYFVSYNLLKNKKKLKSFIQYSTEDFWFIILNLLFAFIFSFLLIIIISFIISKIENLFSFLLHHHIHSCIEEILSVSFNIFFAHIIALLFIFESIKNKKNNKVLLNNSNKLFFY